MLSQGIPVEISNVIGKSLAVALEMAVVVGCVAWYRYQARVNPRTPGEWVRSYARSGGVFL